MIPTRAMENTVYAMAVNRVGEESGFRFIGSSSIVDPSGRVLARRVPIPRRVLAAEIDPARARQKHLVRVPGRHEIDRIAIAGRGFMTSWPPERARGSWPGHAAWLAVRRQ